LLRHLALPFRRCQQKSQVLGQIARVAGTIKINSESFFVCHLAEIREIHRDYWYTVGAGQVGDAAGTRRGGIRHNHKRRCLKKIGDVFFADIAGELDSRIARATLLNGSDVARSPGMIAACDYQLGIWNISGNKLKGFQDWFQPLVGAPFPECQNAMLRKASLRKVRRLRVPR
jgi:hypothetical protein